MSSHHKSNSLATPSTDKGSTQELLNDQLNDWWMTTVLADTGFMTEDTSECSLGWEYSTEAEPAHIVIDESPMKKKGSSRKERTNE